MWSIRNYNAFLKAARRTGGLSLPAARIKYRKVSARLGRSAKGTDVRNHPRIFRDSLSKRERANIPAKKIRKPVSGGKIPGGEKRIPRKRFEGPVSPPAKRLIRTIEEFESLHVLTDFEQGEKEYASTPEYKKKKR